MHHKKSLATFGRAAALCFLPALGLPAVALAQNANCASNAQQTRFDPASFVRIFEDTGGQRIPLYTPGQGDCPSRLLSADRESTLVIDVADILEGMGNDVALNQVFIRAQLKGPRNVEVVGYSSIGRAAGEEPSQIAFAFQTFDNIAAKLVNLYFTARDLIESTYPASPCFSVLARGEAVNSDARRAACGVASTEQMNAFKDRLGLFAPEAAQLSTFFSSMENRTINAQLAVDIFEIDIESLQAIAGQITAERAHLMDPDVTDGAKANSLGIILERTKLVVQDLSGVIFAIQKIQCAADAACGDAGKLSPAALGELCRTADTARTDSTKLQDLREFARGCFIEAKKKEYVDALKKYLIEGTINLAAQDTAVGDVLSIVVETRSPGQAQGTTGAQAEFRVRLTNYGWKTSIDASLFFIKRIGVNEADANRPAGDPVKSLQAVRFAPFPGTNLALGYNGGRTGFDKFLHYLAPAAGVNATFMTFGPTRDFDPSLNDGKGQFVTTNGQTFELGAGPMVSLFGGKVSATYGWNLMAPNRRTYWGLGFGFLSVGRDLVGLIRNH